MSKDTKLEPGKGLHLVGLEFNMNGDTLTFYKSEHDAPAFFNLEDL